jgi:superfamily II DNA or RNA helicase
VFLDHFPTVNSFLARFFVNRGQTDNRWELKPHALEPFYRALSHWALFLTNPSTYGWSDNCGTVPPIRVHVEHVELTNEQSALIRSLTGKLVVTSLGGITSRSTMGQIAKGNNKGDDVPTNKFAHIKGIVDKEPDRSTIIWCHYNDEQDRVAEMLPDAANIDGSTPHLKRQELIDDFKAGRRRVLISKPKILGFGLNLQIATRQIFSGLQDSYEEYYQAVKRSNRIGSTKPLDVYIPVTEIERPMIETVLRKAKMIEHDTREQERIFKQFGVGLMATSGT